MANVNKQETATVAKTIQEKSITDEVWTRINSLQEKGELQLPKNYSAANALKSAWLILQEVENREHKPVLQACSRVSICNALLDMTIQGLTPAKKQCYFVAFGNKLQLMRSYMGDIAVTKRIKGVKDVKPYCLFEGDQLDTEYNVDTAVLKVTKYVPDFKNIDIAKITGAFMVVVGENGPLHTEIMTMAQIKRAWAQGAAKGNSGAHQNFTEEMAKKTVIHRGCKAFINTSDDSDLLTDSYNRSLSEDDENIVQADYEVSGEIKENANVTPIDIKADSKPTESEPVSGAAKSDKQQQNKQPDSQQMAMEQPEF